METAVGACNSVRYLVDVRYWECPLIESRLYIGVVFVFYLQLPHMYICTYDIVMINKWITGQLYTVYTKILVVHLIWWFGD